MARGLSPLQVSILRIAYDRLSLLANRIKAELDKPEEDRDLSFIDKMEKVDVSEIFVSYYGWKLTGRRFSKNSIGPRKYMAAKVAVHKSLRRLEERGLIIVDKNRDYPLGYFMLTSAEGWAAEELFNEMSQPSALSLKPLGAEKFYDILPRSHRNVIELFKIGIYGLRKAIIESDISSVINDGFSFS